MKNLTKLQSNLYKELEKVTSIEEFNKGYQELIRPLTKGQRAYYSRYTVFNQGYIKGTPANLSYEDQQKLIVKAGYKQPHSDRAWISFNQVMGELFKAVV